MNFPFSGFICLCEASGNNTNSIFRENLKTDDGESVFRVIYSPDCQVYEKNGITAILWGNLYHGLSVDKIPWLYQKYNEDTGLHLPGSYAILIIDSIKKRAVVISDKVSSKPLYFARWDSTWIVSASFVQLARYLPGEQELDPAGVAWYLTNGIIQNGHTLFRSVKRLDRATIYTGNARTFTSHEYWKFDFFNAHGHANERTLTERMKEVLSAAVSDCLPRDEPVYLSLSGGYDSSGLLAVMKYALNLQNVRTFSYGLGDARPFSDPALAREIAGIAGYGHFLQKSYNDDFFNALELNVLWGDGISNYCDEVWAWQSLGNEFGDYRPVCFFGDTVFACGLYNELNDEKDVLEAILIRDMDFLPWLDQYIPRENFNHLQQTLTKECGELLAKSRSCSLNLYDQANYLVLEARGRVAHVPWRTNFCSKAFTPVNPLYHDDCLEFQKTIPQEFREHKRLFINTVKELAPGFYQSGTAKSMGYVPCWKNEISRNYQMILSEYLNKGNCDQLESIISTESIINIISNEIIARPVRVKKPYFTSLVTKFLRKHELPVTTAPVKKKLAPEKFILRYLVLKKTLQCIREMRR